jgi:hypothetical protein
MICDGTFGGGTDAARPTGAGVARTGKAEAVYSQERISIQLLR